MNDLCPACGAYWECEHKERYRPLLLDMMTVSSDLDSLKRGDVISITDLDVTIRCVPIQ